MTWLLLSILTAFCESWKDVFGKVSVEKFDPLVVAWALKFFSLPFLLPLLFFIDVPKLNTSFWVALVICSGLNIVTSVLYMKALKVSELSLSVPMLTFTPLFLLLTSPIIVGEFPNAMGVAGILLIVSGSYILNIKERKKGYLGPLKALFGNKGPRIMLLAAFIWSITSNFDKVGVQNSSPLFWTVAVVIFIMISMFPLVIADLRLIGIMKIIKFKPFFVMGLLFALTLIFQMIAVSMTLVAYVIAIKRTSSLLGVVWGHYIFKESGIQERFLGAIIMLIGVVFICLF